VLAHQFRRLGALALGQEIEQPEMLTQMAHDAVVVGEGPIGEEPTDRVHAAQRLEIEGEGSERIPGSLLGDDTSSQLEQVEAEVRCRSGRSQVCGRLRAVQALH
jgi:hypothetical protein